MKYIKKFESTNHYLKLDDYITLQDILVDIIDDGYDYEMYSYFDHSWRVNPNNDSKIEAIRINFSRYEEKWDIPYTTLVADKLQNIINYASLNGLTYEISQLYFQIARNNSDETVTRRKNIKTIRPVNNILDIDEFKNNILNTKTDEISIRLGTK